MNLKILNSKEIKKIINKIKEQYGINELKLDYVLLKNRDNKIFILSKDFAKIDTKNLKLNSLGLYFATIEQDGIRLSIEGSQLIGQKATKNIFEIDKQQLKDWLIGSNIKTDKGFNNYIIIKYKHDYLGIGRYKNNLILNYIPKERRIRLK